MITYYSRCEEKCLSNRILLQEYLTNDILLQEYLTNDMTFSFNVSLTLRKN